MSLPEFLDALASIGDVTGELKPKTEAEMVAARAEAEKERRREILERNAARG